MTKTVIVVFSDPKAGVEEALGRVFNALFLTSGLKDRDAEVELVFQGASARWPAELARPDHPAHALYLSVREKIGGVCGACANVFGAAEGARAAGAALIGDKSFPGVEGVLDLSAYLAEGSRLVTF